MNTSTFPFLCTTVCLVIINFTTLEKPSTVLPLVNNNNNPASVKNMELSHHHFHGVPPSLSTLYFWLLYYTPFLFFLTQTQYCTVLDDDSLEAPTYPFDQHGMKSGGTQFLQI